MLMSYYYVIIFLSFDISHRYYFLIWLLDIRFTIIFWVNINKATLLLELLNFLFTDQSFDG